MIESKNKLEISLENVDTLDEEEYALMRKDGFGASDASVLLGVNLYKDIDELIKEKRSKFLTAEEKAIKDKPAVQKGYDLEELILKKAAKELKVELYKPPHMYQFKEHPHLRVNFDGLTPDLIPVECKLVTKWAAKYYKKDMPIHLMEMIQITNISTSIAEHIKRVSELYGFPGYYYTQLQQQIAGADAPYGYLAVLFDEEWKLKIYKVKRDDYVINKLYAVAENYASKIKEA